MSDPSQINPYPLRDLASEINRRAKEQRRNAFGRLDEAFCRGYEKALDEFIIGFFKIQETHFLEAKEQA